MPSSSRGGSVVFSCGVLDIDTIYNWSVFVWEVLRLFGVRMGEIDLEFGNVVIYGEADSLLGVDGVVVPFKVDAVV